MSRVVSSTVEPEAGIEPATCSLRESRSATELLGRGLTDATSHICLDDPDVRVISSEPALRLKVSAVVLDTMAI